MRNILAHFRNIELEYLTHLWNSQVTSGNIFKSNETRDQRSKEEEEVKWKETGQCHTTNS